MKFKPTGEACKVIEEVTIELGNGATEQWLVVEFNHGGCNTVRPECLVA
jgi:hypothetical protein